MNDHLPSEVEEIVEEWRQRETGSRASPPWGPGAAVMGGLYSFCHHCSYLVGLGFFYGQPEVSHLVQKTLASLFLWLDLSVFYKDPLTKQPFLSSGAFSPLWRLIQKHEGTRGVLSSQKNFGKHRNKGEKKQDHSPRVSMRLLALEMSTLVQMSANTQTVLCQMMNIGGL